MLFLNQLSVMKAERPARLKGPKGNTVLLLTFSVSYIWANVRRVHLGWAYSVEVIFTIEYFYDSLVWITLLYHHTICIIFPLPEMYIGFVLLQLSQPRVFPKQRQYLIQTNLEKKVSMCLPTLNKVRQSFKV